MIGRTAAAICATLGLILMAACAGDSTMKPEDYFARVGADMQTLDRDLGEIDATARASNDIGDEGLGRLIEHLRLLAAGLDQLDPPSYASEAHHDLRVATLRLADLLTDSATAPAEDRTARGLTLTNDWTTACHKLQDIALAGKIDADLRCATALHAR